MEYSPLPPGVLAGITTPPRILAEYGPPPWPSTLPPPGTVAFPYPRGWFSPWDVARAIAPNVVSTAFLADGLASIGGYDSEAFQRASAQLRGSARQMYWYDDNWGVAALYSVVTTELANRYPGSAQRLTRLLREAFQGVGNWGHEGAFYSHVEMVESEEYPGVRLEQRTLRPVLPAKGGVPELFPGL